MLFTVLFCGWIASRNVTAPLNEAVSVMVALAGETSSRA
jgi:hypothetical protein